MQSGDFNWIKFGGVKNPRSMLSSDVFNLETYDGEDPPNLIAKGPIDIIRMTEMSKFDVFEILIDNPINGAQSTYTISFEAKTQSEMVTYSIYFYLPVLSLQKNQFATQKITVLIRFLAHQREVNLLLRLE